MTEKASEIQLLWASDFISRISISAQKSRYFSVADSIIGVSESRNASYIVVAYQLADDLCYDGSLRRL